MGRRVARGFRLSLFDCAVCLLAGCGLWASFPDLSIAIVMIPSAALMISCVDRVGAWRAAFYMFLVGLAFWLPLIPWTAQATGGSVLPWIALSVVETLFFSLWGATYSGLMRLSWARFTLGQVVVTAVSWVGIEQLRSHFPWSGFPWGNLAYPQVATPLGHLAPWGGEVLVSAAVIACAVCLRRAFDFTQRGGLHWYSRPLALVGAVAIFCAPIALPLHSSQENGALTVAAIQGNIELPALETYAQPGKVTGNHARLTKDLAASKDHVDLVIWGESSTDRDPLYNRLVSGLIGSAAQDVQAPILVGITRLQDDRRYNYMGVWYPGSGLSESYYGKQIPVPFGEYIPARSIISRLATEAAQVDIDLEAVDNSSRFDVTVQDGRVVPLAMGICFEVAYEDLLGEGVASGGQIIVIPSNNYHFGLSAEGSQQTQIARFRAIEFSRSTVQASTTGNSIIVRPDGSVVAQSGRMQSATLTAEVPLRSSLTWAARIAPYSAKISWASTGILLVLLCMQTIRRSQGKRRS